MTFLQLPTNLLHKTQLKLMYENITIRFNIIKQIFFILDNKLNAHSTPFRLGGAITKFISNVNKVGNQSPPKTDNNN